MSVVGSPSASAFVTVAVSVSAVCGEELESETVALGALFATVREALAAGPSTAPSFGVTVTDTASPRSPSPAPERSRVSLSDAEPLVISTVVPLTFQTYVRVVASRSASETPAVAVSVSFVRGEAGASETVAPARSSQPWRRPR